MGPPPGPRPRFMCVSGGHALPTMTNSFGNTQGIVPNRTTQADCRLLPSLTLTLSVVNGSGIPRSSSWVRSFIPRVGVGASKSEPPACKPGRDITNEIGNTHEKLNRSLPRKGPSSQELTQRRSPSNMSPWSLRLEPGQTGFVLFLFINILTTSATTVKDT